MRAGIHPFPARMAPDLALKTLEKLEPGSMVLDPMTGSGTVARLAVERGHSVAAFDLDPLAVLISKVSTTLVDDSQIEVAAANLLREANRLDTTDLVLPWIDGDETAESFISYWFGLPQRRDLRGLAFLLSNPAGLGISDEVADVLRIALSRIIVTKKQCASLAQDTSHSRPHKVVQASDYDVFNGFSDSVATVRRRLKKMETTGTAQVALGDARSLDCVAASSVDRVLTSPPYLNAIDYMRGHRLSLIWLGHRYSDLVQARSNSIGSERRPDEPIDQGFFGFMKRALGDLTSLPNRYHGFIERYVVDLYKMISEVLRVLKQGAKATFVMGNSCLRNVYIQNSEALKAVAAEVGLRLADEWERELPTKHRYLPLPMHGALGKRMRKEIILTFAKV